MFPVSKQLNWRLQDLVFLEMLCWIVFGSPTAMKNEVNWRNGFAIGDSNTKTGPLNVLFSRLMRKA